MTGLLLLNKPAGMRSTKCVELVRRILGKKIKVGHGGTLDSTASGLLIILVGAATRLSNFVMDMPKCYETILSLGTETSTDDASGEVLKRCGFSGVEEKDIDLALASFMGWRMQAPPEISAVHIDGRRAHELAREGYEVKTEHKPVFFRSVTRTGPLSDDGKVPFRIWCSKGTYIRSFARDIGQLLGCGAHVCELKRISCGPFAAESAVDAASLETMGREVLRENILPVESISSAAATYLCGEEDEERLINGLSVPLERLKRKNFARWSSPSGNVAVISDKIFSICRSKDNGSSCDLLPAVNIINDRSN